MNDVQASARAWIAALRTGHDRLADFAATADVTAPSMCTDWTIAQVLSHLGSGAEIGLGTVSGAPVVNEEVWARWNALAPADAASSFVASDERLVAWWEARTDEELSTMEVELPFLPAPIDAVGALGFRLTELALHSWDVLAADDTSASVAPEAVPLLLDRLPTMVGMLGRFTPRETRPATDTTVAVETSDPARAFELELGDGVDLRPVDDPSGTGRLGLPAEALLRLTSGRLADGRTNGATADGALSLDDLRRAFPGY